MDRKGVGIITMHRVVNYGSILQAYALQKVIDDMGYDAELIDYEYPNAYQYERGVNRPSNDWKTKVLRVMSALHLTGRKGRRMKNFMRKHYKLSPYYPDFNALHSNPPSYDLYMTGSDQVWNIKHTLSDGSFLLDFAPTHLPKVSYAASFAGNPVSQSEHADRFGKLLSAYRKIAVREKDDADIVLKLTGSKPAVTLDPTLLLDADCWGSLASKTNYGLRPGSYILLYVLSYAFDPRPYIFDLAAYISVKTGLPVVAIDDDGSYNFPHGSRCIRDAGPREILSLFRGASCVVTSSFHGSAFAVNFGCPVYGVVNENLTDSRISSFLREMQLSSSIIPIGTDFKDISLDMDMQCAKATLAAKRKESLDYLYSTIAENIG